MRAAVAAWLHGLWGCTDPGREGGTGGPHPVALALPVVVAVLDGIVANDMPTDAGVWASIGLASAGLLLRRHVPEVALLAGLPGVFLGHLSLAPLFALYFVASVRGRLLISGAAAALSTLTLLLSYYLVDASAIVFHSETVFLVLEGCLWPVAALMAGHASRAWKERLCELREGRLRENRMLTERVLTGERNRLAREMHDVVAHKVSLISLQAGALQVGGPQDVDVRDSARLIHELASQTITELHHMLGVLRAAGGSDADDAPRARVVDIGDLVRSSGVAVDLHLADVPTDVPEAVERAVYRTVQEALTNIRKHAPGAPARVRVDLVAAGLRVEVSNPPGDRTAPSPNVPGGGRGLVGLRERAHLLGGEFRAGSTPHGGFVVRALLPVERATSDATAGV
ncbi:sensor histidine kinase [Streptomyces sp. NPDC059917]|uniref:sensor histidine kinase n=1 Tax=Streptomyces sp. NPDC059917 TaxID=3347002 RepID=UPI00366039FF